MKKSELKRQLSRIEAFEDPKVELEQYQTPAELAADIVHTSYMQGDRKVVDLGSGTGIIAFGAALAGMEVTAVEIDDKAIEKAEKHAEKLGLDIDFLRKDVRNFRPEEDFDAVLMNPPFNIQSDEGPVFWRKALEIGDRVYGLAGKGFETSLKHLCKEYNHEIIGCEAYEIVLPATYDFHTEKGRETPVELYITEEK
jgi:putative methylase